MLTASLTNESQLIQRLRDPKPQVMRVLTRVVTALTIKLQSRIVKEKLSGQLLNVISGRLRRSIGYDVDSGDTQVIGRVFSSGVPYARIQNDGGTTRPHLILPRTAVVLAFTSRGQKVFATKVNHPGSRIKGTRYMQSGLRDMQNEIRGALVQAVIEGTYAK